MHHLLGKPPSAPALAEYLGTLSGGTVPAPEIKSYPDVVYVNYATLGVSLQFSPRNRHTPAVGDQLKDGDLQLEAVDMYNVSGTDEPVRSGGPTFATYRRLPVELRVAGATLTIGKGTTGKEFVGWLGEPSRKGGGAGPSSGSIHIWCEWSQQGIMVEFGGSDARGPQAWERGGDAVWRVVTVFEPKSECARE